MDSADDNHNVIALPDHLFLNAIASTDIEQACLNQQADHQDTLERWALNHNLSKGSDGYWHQGSCIVVVEDNDLRRGVTSLS